MVVGKDLRGGLEMSGRDEQPNIIERFVSPTLEVYYGWIQHVIEFMQSRDLVGVYTIEEIMYFTELSELSLSRRWERIIANGVKREMLRAETCAIVEALQCPEGMRDRKATNRI